MCGRTLICDHELLFFRRLSSLEFMKKSIKICAVGALICSLCIFLMALFFDDTVTSYYSAYSEAKADSIFERGWLPEFIPFSSRKIITKNNLDINTSNGEFYISAEDTVAFISKLAPYGNHQFEYLERNLKILNRLREGGYTAYEYANNDSIWIFFVNIQTNHVLYDFLPNRYDLLRKH